MNVDLKEFFPKATVLSDSLPDYALLEQDNHLILAGSEEGIKKGIGTFLQSGLLTDFRFVRTLYKNGQTKGMVLDSLRSTREKIRKVLEEHYGEFDYSPYESAFDEYLVAMRKEHGITISDQQVMEHAGAGSMEALHAKGYRTAHKYILDRMDYREREGYITANGGMSYHDWAEKEIDRFLQDPSLLIRQYSAVFENIFPDVVTVDAESFIPRFRTLEVPLMAELVFGPKVQQDTATAGNTRMVLIRNISMDYRTWWH